MDKKELVKNIIERLDNTSNNIEKVLTKVQDTDRLILLELDD